MHGFPALFLPFVKSDHIMAVGGTEAGSCAIGWFHICARMQSTSSLHVLGDNTAPAEVQALLVLSP